jgi:hypothetical protein
MSSSIVSHHRCRPTLRTNLRVVSRVQRRHNVIEEVYEQVPGAVALSFGAFKLPCGSHFLPK